MKISYFIICVSLLMACQPKPENATTDIEHLMKQQEEAWNRGDIDAFMASYWNNDSLVFIGKSGLSYGWQKVLKNYKEGYPDRAAMGQLQFKNLLHRQVGQNHHWVAGQWTIFRQSDTIGGHYTLVWQKMNGKWVIISDHSS